MAGLEKKISLAYPEHLIPKPLKYGYYRGGLLGSPLKKLSFDLPVLIW